MKNATFLTSFGSRSICVILKLNILALLIFIPGLLLAQEYYSGKVWIIVNNPEIIPQGEEISINNDFAEIISQFNITEITQPMSFAKTLQLRNLFELNTELSEDFLFNELVRINVNNELFYSIEKCPIPQTLYDPADWMWWATVNDPTIDWLWYLQNIEAPLAWDITKGDPTIKVAVTDNGIDPLHPDLIGKIDPPYNFLGGTPFSPQGHGTGVATLLAGETVDQGQTPNGPMASIGYNTKIMFSYFSLQACLYASTILRADILSLSWYNSCTPYPSALLAEQEILNNGSTIIRAAGNGNGNCSGSKLYPFSGLEDPRTIVISSTGINDHHENPESCANFQTHSHYPEVDLCAPGYRIIAGVETNGGQNTWPYYGCWSGTSMAAPIVSGTAALMLSVNPCLEPADVEFILKSTTDPIIDAANFPNGVGTGRLNAYQAVLMASGYGDYPPLTTNTTWNNEYFVKGDLIIEPGYTLTVTGKIALAKGARIIVKPNARLIVDGGYLTNAKGCRDDFWGGIEVWGNINQHQFPSSHPTYQGQVVVKNGGIIENAREAITLWNPNDWNSMGGMVACNDAVFKNNRRSVTFMKYQNFYQSSGAPLRNFSSFTNTTFTIDDDYLGNNDFFAHVSLWDVDGVYFRNCHFEDYRSTKHWDLSSKKGIISINAGYLICPTCNVTPPLGQECPPNQLNRSSFKGFNYAVHATGSGTTKTIYIDNTDFEENFRNVWVEQLNNFVTTRSNFLIGENTIQNLPTEHEGLVSVLSTGFRIEENNFLPSASPMADNKGVRIFESGTSNNRVYKNNFYNLYIAERADALNRNPNTPYEGLQFLCNLHEGSDYADISVVGDPFSNEGVRIYQGEQNPSRSAGNVFSHTNLDIENNSQWPIIYYHTGGQTEPTNYNGNVFPVQTSNANACPSSFGNDVKHPLTATMKMQLGNDYDTYETAYINLLYNYNQLIDGGNTPALLLEIQLSWPADAWALRDELLSYSPYLSQDVLREAAMRDILPHAMLLEVCLANPEGTMGDDFIRFLQEEIPNPMPQYMLDLIMANWETETARTLLENSLAHYTANMAFNADVLLADLMLDTLRQQLLINSWLARRATLSDRYHLIESYMETNEYQSAQNLLEDIPEDYRLDENLMAEFNDYLAYFSFRKNLNDAQRTIAQLDNPEVAYLNSFVENSTGRAASMASSILCFFYDICRDYPALPSEGFGQRIRPKQTNNHLKNSNKVEIYPNPANSFATINWDLPFSEKGVILHIKDITGRTLIMQDLNGKTGHWIWDTRKIIDGLYLFEVHENGKLVSSGKIVIQK